MKKSGVQARTQSATHAVKTSKASSVATTCARFRITVVAAKKHTSIQAGRDAQIMRLGAVATRLASRQALASGQSITVAEKNRIVKIAPGGQRTFIKNIAPDVVVKQRKMSLK